MPEAAPAIPTVIVLADDLIWATRLSDAIVAAGGVARRARRMADLDRLLAESGDGNADARFAIVDLTARAYDGVAAIRAAVDVGARVVAVGQHDDVQLRKAALEAGAERVFTYRALFENGPRTLAAWLAG